MKQLIFVLPLLALAINSCTKDRSPVIPFNPYMDDTVSYSTTIAPLIMQNCSTTGCHDAATAENGYNLTSHANISASAEKMYDAMRGLNGFTQMPYSADPLPDTSIYQFEAWIVQGKLNN